MIRPRLAALAAAAALLGAALSAQELPHVHRDVKTSDMPRPAAGMLNLSCVEALVAVEHPDLAGVFSFITEKDAPAAFADFVAHNKTAMRRYVDKIGADIKSAAGVTPWDHDVIMRILDIYAGPLAETLEKLPPPIQKRLMEYSAAPSMSLEDVAARRKTGR